jgi:phosphatidylglycerophosphate synthase
VNLPNAITVARIAASPLIAWLPFAPNWGSRLTAFVLYLAAAITDYWDGHLARTRNLVTDLGRLLDPLADKLLLVATFVPMLWLMGAAAPLVLPLGHAPRPPFAFVTPLGFVTMPWWVAAVVLGREFAMTVFRQYAARRGLVIAAIGPAKWKTGSSRRGSGPPTSGSSPRPSPSARAGARSARGARSPCSTAWSGS